MPKVTDDHTESRRNQILGAAIACFAQTGYHKTSMRDICKQANLSAGAVYHYFKSKDEIVVAVAENLQEMNSNMFKSARESTSDINQVVEKNVDNYRDFMKQPLSMDCARADTMFNAEALTNPELRKLGVKSYDLILNFLTELVKEWQASGEINTELSPEAIAKVMFSTVQSLQLQKIIEPELDVDEYFAVVKAMLFGNFKLNQ